MDGCIDNTAAGTCACNLILHLWLIIFHAHQYEKHTIPVEYKGAVREFEMHSRPLLQYFLDQAADPILARKAEWHAIRKSRWDGTEWEPVFDEPMTGERAWECEVSVCA